ncbi:uncharacterized protein LOC126555014 [Aphis gossypii]|uniref:uncharacterized protein LOC126555014 n=1 Tax=Aphis gossypii TaxID=80765 RepID=UPI002158EF37|nr:uncharacterized protein LOC126555014 [Aphis gossypii]
METIVLKKKKSPFKWDVSASNSPLIDKQKISSPIPKSWIITPVKLQTTETPIIQCKKKLDFYSEPIYPKITKDNNVSTCHTVQSGSDRTSSGDLMNKLYRTVVSLKYDVKEILIKLDRLENTATDNQARLIMTGEIRDNEQESAILWNFPITSLDEMALFEEKLLERSFRLKMIKDLSLMVRNTVSETVRQMLSRMFINEVLSKYSFVGQKKNYHFLF